MITRRKILIVDDDDDLHQSLKEQLVMNGEFEILAAETAAKGIDVIKKEHLDLVVLDVGLPDMDGREMCKHVPQAWLQETTHADCQQLGCR